MAEADMEGADPLIRSGSVGFSIVSLGLRKGIYNKLPLETQLRFETGPFH